MVAVGVNAHLLTGEAGYRRAGIHHHIEQLLVHLPPRSDWRYHIFTRYRAPWLRDDRHRVPTAWPTERRWLRILWEQSALPLAARQLDLDLLHCMAYVLPLWSPCPGLVTVHDLGFLHYPRHFPPLQRLYLASQTRRSCRTARRVITVSESGRQDVHRFWGVPRDNIDVVQLGVDNAYRPLPPAETAAFRQQKDLPERFILHVGTLQPRKNIPVLLRAMAQLGPAGVPLVLVGGKGWLYDEIFALVESLGLQDRVRFAGYVPDEELPHWYNAATLLAFPSLYEGFGLPVLEAMACGTPVVAADASALPEIVASAGLLFPPQDVEALVSHILAILDNPSQAATMRERGLDRAKQFTWERAGRQLFASYRRALTNE